MNIRNTAWDLLDICRNTDSSGLAELKNEWHTKSEPLRKNRNQMARGGHDTSFYDKRLYELLKEFNDKSLYLQNIAKLLDFLLENFAIDNLTEDEFLKAQEEAENILRNPIPSDWRNVSVSDAVLPVLILKVALKEYFLPILWASNWRKFAEMWGPLTAHMGKIV